MPDAFDLAGKQIQENCEHRSVVYIDPHWGTDYIEEFGHYRCLDCGKIASYYLNGKLVNSPWDDVTDLSQST